VLLLASGFLIWDASVAPPNADPGGSGALLLSGVIILAAFRRPNPSAVAASLGCITAVFTCVSNSGALRDAGMLVVPIAAVLIPAFVYLAIIKDH